MALAMASLHHMDKLNAGQPVVCKNVHIYYLHQGDIAITSVCWLVSGSVSRTVQKNVGQILMKFGGWV